MKYITIFLFGAVVGAMVKDNLLIALGTGIASVIFYRIFENKTSHIK